MVKIKSIWLRKAEGYTPLPKPVTVHSYKDAEKVLLHWSTDAPRDGCYDKTDFKITFEGGETYEGRLDIKHFTCDDNDIDLAKHVRNFILFHAGEHKPKWMTDEQYKEVLKSHDQKEFKEFYNKYDLNQNENRGR